MRVAAVDERDSGWENGLPCFRVYLFSAGPPAGGIVWTYDIADADALEVLRWAQDEAGGDRLYAVALVVDHESRGRGLVWLAGMDINCTPNDDVERARRATMVRRQGVRLVLDEPASGR